MIQFTHKGSLIQFCRRTAARFFLVARCSYPAMLSRDFAPAFLAGVGVGAVGAAVILAMKSRGKLDSPPFADARSSESPAVPLKATSQDPAGGTVPASVFSSLVHRFLRRVCLECFRDGASSGTIITERVVLRRRRSSEDFRGVCDRCWVGRCRCVAYGQFPWYLKHVLMCVLRHRKPRRADVGACGNRQSSLG
jgi:hypothetical protein